MDGFGEETNPFREDAASVDGTSISDLNTGFGGTEAAESRPLPDSSATLHQSPEPSANRGVEPPPTSKTQAFLHSGGDVEILITDAQKTSENSSSPYIVYIIRTGNTVAKRRYSDFESLRNGLAKLHPTLIIPPIPSKQTLGDYAVKQAKAKEDATMIARRKRMLQVFLNRIAGHAILSNEQIFHRFLDPNVSWSEVLRSPPLSLLPKNLIKAPAQNPADTESIATYSALPTPPASHTLRNPDQRFLDSENFTNRFAGHLNGSMDKVTRRTMKRWSDFSHDHAELGAVLNGFSLTQSGTLATAIEKTGQAIDATYMSTARLLQDMEQTWTEPLHEYGQFANIIKKILVYRHQKHAQYELTQDALENKRESLEALEKSEAEARRLEQALSRAGTISGPRSLPPTPISPTSPEGDADAAEQSTFSDSVRTPSSPSTYGRRRGGSAYGFLSALSHSISGMMDVDPEVARRNAISKTRDSISQLEAALQASTQDLKYASSTIQGDLDRFQRQKVADLREMALSMARIHRDWCKLNLEAWEAAKKDIDKIEPHPNRPPPGEELPPSPKRAPGPPSMSRGASQR